MTNKRLLICFALLAGLAFTACTDLLAEADKADKKFLEADSAELAIGYTAGDSASSVTADITLPKDISGSAVSWSSANSAIANDGTVTRPTGPDVTGDLTATITRSGASAVKVFALTVRAMKDVTFSSLTANGTSADNPMERITTSSLELIFDSDPSTLKAGDIMVTGATRGVLSGTGLTRSLGISDITVANGEDVTVAIAGPPGFTFTPTVKNVAVHVGSASPTDVAFTSLTQINGVSNSATTTALLLSFDVNPATLTQGDITVTGATKGSLSGSGTTRTLTISNIGANGDTLTVSVASPSGFLISGSPRTVMVYKESILILTAGVTGFVAPVTGVPKQLVGTLSAGASAYTVASLTWNPTTTPYEAGTVYTATVSLTSAAGYRFPATGIMSPTATAGGGTVSAGTTSGGDVSGNSLTFTVSFPATVSDASVVAAAKAALAITYGSGDSASSVTKNVTLPAFGSGASTVSWAETADAGDNIAIAGTTGTITRPAYPSGNGSVTIRATISKGLATDTKDFTLVILAPVGTVADPCQIFTLAQLVAMRDNVNGAAAGANAKAYKLMADIDLASINTGIGWVPIGNTTTKFTGTFNGNGKTISNLFINDPAADYKGLFGYTSNATITDLTLTSIAVTGKALIGGLVGYCEYGGSIISNCSVTGTVTGAGYDVGGLAGYARATITNSNTAVTVSMTVSSATATGGLLGCATYATITNCHATGTVQSAGYYVGGLVGYNNSSSNTISASYATGAVTGLDYAGGLIGYQDGGASLTNCFATGSVHTTGVSGWGGRTGGLVGSSSGAVGITNCYAAGAVTSAYTSSTSKGGLVGAIESGAITATKGFYDTNTTGMTAANTNYGTATTTANMKLQSTFTGWNFTTIWNIGAGYPYLR